MTTNNNISLLIVGLLFGLLIGYLATSKYIKKEVEFITRNDTIIQYEKVPEIKIETKTKFVERQVLDTVNKERAELLFKKLDSVKSELNKFNVREIAKLDTIHNNDTINVSYEYFTKQWYINMRLAERPVKTITNTITVTKTETSDNIYYWSGGSFLVGVILGVVAAK